MNCQLDLAQSEMDPHQLYLDEYHQKTPVKILLAHLLFDEYADEYLKLLAKT